MIVPATESVNSARAQLFAKKGRTLENIPPTRGALLLHIKRTVHQAGYIWGQCLVANPVLPNPCDWDGARLMMHGIQFE
jgi:hypothetical protein